MGTAYREKAFLEKSGRALKNAVTHAEVSASLAEFIYDQTKLAEGQSLLDNTLSIWKTNTKEHLDESSSHDLFEEKYSELETLYRRDKRRAKAILHNDSFLKEKLLIDSRTPVSYDNFLTTVEGFYGILNEDQELLDTLSPMKFTSQSVSEALNLISDVRQGRINYLQERGESQLSTTVKNKALQSLDYWMRDFYTVAKIALEDKKQLLEILEIQVN